MCSRIILAQSNTAIVSSSEKCDCIHLTLPNITIKLGREGFAELTSYINSLIERRQISNNKYFVETPYQGVILYFAPDEMASLSKVLTRSLLKLELPELAFEQVPSEN